MQHNPKLLMGMVCLCLGIWLLGRIDLAGDGQGAPLAAAGHIHYAESCQQDDVQEAVDAAQDGDTVFIPPGRCEWNTPYGYDGSNWKAAIQIVRKSVFLLGAGTEKTTIVNRIPYAWNNSAIHIESQEDKAVRISGITLTDVSTESTSRFIIIDGNGTWRLDHCQFAVSPNKFGGERYIIFPYTYGVIDHTTFVNALVNFKNAQDGVPSWNTPISLGTDKATYVEDSTFYYDGAAHGQHEDFIDGEGGARVVIRHNTVTNAEFHFHGIEGGSLRGIHSYELYDNVLIDDGTVNNYRRGSLRGGTGVVFNNTWVGNWSSSAAFYVVHQCLTIQKDPDDHRCDGEKWCYGYPCKDQIGRTSDADGDGEQDLAPLFAWNNTDDGQAVQLQVQADYCPDCVEYIQEGRDYYNDTVSYDPATGTYTTTYTEDSIVKQWNYKPYTYPHPLTQDVQLTTTPFHSAVRLDWEVVTAFPFPNNTTWQIEYATGNSTPIVAASGLLSTTQAYTLTNLSNSSPYTITLSGIVDDPEDNPLAWTTATTVVTTTGLALYGRPGDHTIYLDWEIAPAPPTTTTWQIEYYTTTLTAPYITTISQDTTRSTILTAHVYNHQMYTITLNAMLDETAWLSDTVQVMPTDQLLYLPLILHNQYSESGNLPKKK